MNKNLLNTQIQEFINSNLNSDVSKIALKGSPFVEVTIQELIEQIEAKKKSKQKLSTWYNTKNIYYPNKLNIEQTSSEITANYKSCLISGQSIIDLTGGFGIDSYFFSKRFINVIHCETNEKLSQIVSHNYKQLNTYNVKCIYQDGIAYLKNSQQVFDWIYIDPSRRHDSKGKVFYLKDCLPNVPEHLLLFFSKTDNILVKTSPMLDLSIGISELKYVKTIHIIAVKNEVKEVLFHLKKRYQGEVEIKTINLNVTNTQNFDFKLSDEQNAIVTYGEINHYLYEPNGALLKSGAYKLISERLKLQKLHKHTHLYTLDELIDFPGRRFKVIQAISYNKKRIVKTIGNKKVNLSTRNFPESIHTLKTKYKLKDGGNTFVFFTTQGNNEKIVLICEKID